VGPFTIPNMAKSRTAKILIFRPMRPETSLVCTATTRY
jgi:hypothetical protein